jgi:hypothetical protein
MLIIIVVVVVVVAAAAVTVVISRKVRCAGHVTRIGEMRNAYKILVEIPKGKTPRGRSRH